MTLAESLPARSHNRPLVAAAPDAPLDAPAAADPGSPNPHAPRASALAPDPHEIRAFQRDLQWLLDHDDVVPTKLHVAGVEPDSALGSPAMAKPWQTWLDRGERAIDVTTVEERCFHGGLSELDVRRGIICPSCAVLDADGKPIGQSGVRSREIAHYRYPMRAALAKARHTRTEPGLPDPASVCWAILAAGDWILAMVRLSHRYPALASGRVCYDVARRSVAAVKARFQVEVPPRALPREKGPARPSYAVGQKSDAQLDAEAAS